jgi:hypothetical protein
MFSLLRHPVKWRVFGSARQAFDRAGGDGAGEPGVVTLVLIGVPAGEPGDRGGEVLALPDVAIDGHRVAGAGVGAASVSPHAVANSASRGAIRSVVGMIFMSRNCRT